MPNATRRILLLNGPNLNMTGTREPERYGTRTLGDIVSDLQRLGETAGANVEHFQSNVEGALIERAQQARDDGTDAIIINAGALTHTSIGLRDALLASERPFIEVHLSNVFAREAFRHHSYISDIAVGVIVGFGATGYALALQAVLEHLSNTAG
ncbi:MAG: type II 3-dehydroquinate dehydratase [Pseudomonadota bacterium]